MGSSSGSSFAPPRMSETGRVISLMMEETGAGGSARRRTAAMTGELGRELRGGWRERQGGGGERKERDREGGEAREGGREGETTKMVVSGE